MNLGLNPRPDPLLKPNNYKSGSLTIFLGAATGVGKTYAMLEAANERQQEGIDVVAGWVNTHGRGEMEALLENIPIIPPITLQYRESKFQEMDLDAILRRHPELVLVDELAHSNIPGSRHLRRYYDVEEMLDAGINVYTTVNIQHLESLNDVVAQITGVQVDDTVPDRFMEKADRVQLIDVPAEELIHRLKEGKVCISEPSALTVDNFYSLGNLNALRELALRYTVQRVDHQLDNYRLEHGISGQWPVGERVMACISASPFAGRVLRSARRIAAQLKAELLVIYVEAPGYSPRGPIGQDSLNRNLQLATELGAQVITVSGQDIAKEILNLAHSKNVTQLVVGKPLHSRWRDIFQGSLVDKILRGSDGISIHIIPGEPLHLTKNRVQATARNLKIWPYISLTLQVMLITLGFKLFSGHVTTVDIALLYLLPVLVGASLWGRSPSIYGAIISVLALDLFFVPPFLSFSVADLKYLFSFAMFLLVAIITGNLATRLKRQADEAVSREVRTNTLYRLSRELAAVTELESVLYRVVNSVAVALGNDCWLLLPDNNGNLLVKAQSNSGNHLLESSDELAVANWSFQHREIAGFGTKTLPGATAIYYPLNSNNKVLGVLGLQVLQEPKELSLDQLHLLETLAGLAALAIGRSQLAEEANRLAAMEETDKLRTALFNSVSHDLRTPLASITGAVTSLQGGKGVYQPNEIRELLQVIKAGAERMNRLVGNLLDSARLESGMLQLKHDWCDMQDIIGVVLRQYNDDLQGRGVNVEIAPDAPLVIGDEGLLEQVMSNLLDNAIKYSPEGTPITVRVNKEIEVLQVTVANWGAALSAVKRERIFDRFYRLKMPEIVSGTGLGLANSKAIIEAHGGSIWAESGVNGGNRFVFILPADQQPDIKGDMD